MHRLPRDPHAVIRELLSRHLRYPADVDDDTPLVTGGLLDSMALVDLLLDLQDAFGVQLRPAEVESDDFDSVHAIAATLARGRREQR
jgi:acyl carrier protein